MLMVTLSSSDLAGYTAAVTFLLLGLLFFSLFLAARDFQLFRESREQIHCKNALLWCAGAGMDLFTLLFVLMRKGWFMGMVLLIGVTLVYSTVGDGVRDQLKNY